MLSQPVQQAEIADLVQSIDGDELEAIAGRAEESWKQYLEVLRDSTRYSPGEVDDATEALERCMSRELQALRSLNQGVVPTQRLRNAWDEFCSGDG